MAEYAPFSECPGEQLTWRRPQGSRLEYQLVGGDRRFADLVWARAGIGPATGTTAEGSWILERHGGQHLLDVRGHLRPRVSFRPAGGGSEPVEVALGYAESYTLGGANAFGWTYGWEPAGGPSPTGAGAFTTRDGAPLVTIRAARAGQDLPTAEVTISPAALDFPELPLMVLLSWYGIRNGSS